MWEQIQNYVAEHSAGLEAGAWNVLKALGLLAGTWLAAGWISAGVRRALVRTSFDATLTKVFVKLTRIAVMTAGVLGCMGIFGIETTAFAAVLGGASLAIGLAFQGTLGNFAAGIMLIVFRPYRVGDVVTVVGQTAKVDEIGLFTTTLDTPDNRRIIIPNGSIFGTTIENITYHPHRRADVAVGVSYAADIDATRAALLRATSSTPGALAEPEPAVLLIGLGASSVDWSVRVWAPTADFLTVKDGLVRAIKLELDAAGIAIPFPQMDVHLRRGG